MGLNEHEQRVLDELERGLYAEDEQLARRIQKAAAKSPDRLAQASAARRIAGVLVAVAGLGVILVGAIIHWPWMGAGGFVITLSGLAVATGAFGRPASEIDAFGQNPSNSGPKASSTKRAGSGNLKTQPRKNWIQEVNAFFEERWRRRSE